MAVETDHFKESVSVPSGEIVQQINQKFGDKANTFIKIGKCESGLDPTNYNGRSGGLSWEEAKKQGRAMGLFQVYYAVHKHHVPERLLEAEYNIDVAYQLSRGGINLAPWEASRHCWQDG